MLMSDTTTDTTEPTWQEQEAERRDTQRAEWITGLRDLADYLEGRPDLILTYGLEVAHVTYNPEDLAAKIKLLGTSEKYATDNYLGATRQVGPHTVKVVAMKQSTCEQVPTGEVEVKTIVVDEDAEAPEGARQVATKTVTVWEVDEPITEWKCPDSLLAAGGGES